MMKRSWSPLDGLSAPSLPRATPALAPPVPTVPARRPASSTGLTAS